MPSTENPHAVVSVLAQRMGRVLGSAVLAGLLWCASIQGAHALDINQATEAELDSFKGMGPALSAKVLQARAQAPFANWDDLAQRVSGMGPQKLKRFSQQGMTINGQPLSP
jgi:competence protein ComEA